MGNSAKISLSESTLLIVKAVTLTETVQISLSESTLLIVKAVTL